MLYNTLKIIHIISATLLLSSIAYSYCVWIKNDQSNTATTVSERIQTQTWLIILPAAIFQLASGFTMISLQHYDLSLLWIKGSAIGFIGAIGAWFAFIYFLLSGQHLRRTQGIMLCICGISLLCMIFFMANKV
jgi:uncharacterized membrane protein